MILEENGEWPKISHKLNFVEDLPPWNEQQKHLKMNGWKMKFPFEMASWQVRTVSFTKCTVIFITWFASARIE